MRMKRRRPFVSLTKMEMVLGGFTVDLYGEFVVFLGTTPLVFQIKGNHSSSLQEAFQKSEAAMKRFALKVWTMNRLHVYGEEAPQEFLILENGVSYQVFLNDGLMTGIFGPA